MNPVYDEHADDNEVIELRNKGDGANNNVVKPPTENGEVKMTIDSEDSNQNNAETPSQPEPVVGEAHTNGINSTNGGIREPVWHKGTEVRTSTCVFRHDNEDKTLLPATMSFNMWTIRCGI